jgi:hypothetical protein
VAKAARTAHPLVGCMGRANAGHRQKTRRPEGFRGQPVWPRKQDRFEFSDPLLAVFLVLIATSITNALSGQPRIIRRMLTVSIVQCAADGHNSTSRPYLWG